MREEIEEGTIRKCKLEDEGRERRDRGGRRTKFHQFV